VVKMSRIWKEDRKQYSLILVGMDDIKKLTETLEEIIEHFYNEHEGRDKDDWVFGLKLDDEGFYIDVRFYPEWKEHLDEIKEKLKERINKEGGENE